MSDTSKMGLLGSKDGRSSPNEDQMSKDESPERYAPYSVDSDSETYDTEALSIMDINDIIGVQAEPVGDSTLESEIAALSEIITDTKVDSTCETPFNGNIDTKEVVTNTTASSVKVEIVTDSENAKIQNENFSGVSQNSVSHLSDVEFATDDIVCGLQQSLDKDIKENSFATTDTPGMSKSLQLIGESYLSDDSEDFNTDKAFIDNEPKVVLSCKSLADAQSNFDSTESHFAPVKCSNIIKETINISTISSTSEEDDTTETGLSLIRDNNLTKTNDTSSVETEQESDPELTKVTEIIAQINIPKTDTTLLPVNASLSSSNTEKPQSEELQAPLAFDIEVPTHSVGGSCDKDISSTVLTNKHNENDEKLRGFASQLTCVRKFNETTLSEKTNENNLLFANLHGQKGSVAITFDSSERYSTNVLVAKSEFGVTNVPTQIEKETKQINPLKKMPEEIEQPMEIMSNKYVDADPKVIDKNIVENTESQIAVKNVHSSVDYEDYEVRNPTVLIRQQSESKFTMEEEAQPKVLDVPSTDVVVTDKTLSKDDLNTDLKNEIDENVMPTLISQFEKINDNNQEQINLVNADTIEVASETYLNTIENINDCPSQSNALNKIKIIVEKNEIELATVIKPQSIHVQEGGILEKPIEITNLDSENSSDCPDKSEQIIKASLDHSDDTGLNISDMQEEVNEVEAIVKIFPLSENLSLTTETLENLETIEAIDTLENKLSIEDLDDPIVTENMDSLDALLHLDLMPTGESSNIDVAIEENTLELSDKEVDPLLPTLEILLPEPQTNSVPEKNVLLSDSIGTSDVKEYVKINDATDDKNEIKKDINLKENIDLQRIDDDKECHQTNLNSQFDLSFNKTPDDKLDISDDLLTDPLADVDSGVEVSQTNPEISELETAVKFLQESEDHDDDLPEMSLKMIGVESLNEKIDPPTPLYVSTQKVCEDPELVVELEPSVTDPIAISEAEIINEAAKLENERKQLHEESKVSCIISCTIAEEEKSFENVSHAPENIDVETTDIKVDLKRADIDLTCAQYMITSKSTIPKASILEERLKEPPKIEIPIVEPTRNYDPPTTPKASLLIPRDARMQNYQKILESPKSEKSRDDTKTVDCNRKDGDKHEHESVGSPRIILKIAKSAFTDCAEPKSPKSPKFHSTTNSPNPEDSPGQKLGKIKLKWSKGGHPSIISNETADEPLQWHTEGSCSLSPLGMKIKRSKPGDPSIIHSEKFDSAEERRLESPVAMKIKLSRADAPTQQDTKEVGKYKLDTIINSPKRTESPLGMKIKVSKGVASIIQSDKLEDEERDNKTKERSETLHDTVRRTESPIAVKLKRYKTGDTSVLSCDQEETKDLRGREKGDILQDNQKYTDLPTGRKMKLAKKSGVSVISDSDGKDKLEVPDAPRRTESPLGMKFKLLKGGDASIIHSEVIDIHNEQQKSEPNQLSPALVDSSSTKDVESILGTPKRSESSLGMKFRLFKDGDATIIHPERSVEDQEIKRMAEPIIKIKRCKTVDASIIPSRAADIDEEDNKSQKIESTIESMKIKFAKTGHPSIISNDMESIKLKDSIDNNLTFAKRDQLSSRAEVTIEPIQLIRRLENPIDISSKRKDLTISPIEAKKAKLEAKLSQMLPEVTIQPVGTKEQKPNFDQSNSSAISRQQMNVISQEISITQLRPNKSAEREVSMSEKLKNMLTQSQNAPDDCEIIEHHPELIIVNENSNSSQDIMIIDEVPALRIPELKTPKKRGRPRRNVLQFQQAASIPRDPLALDEVAQPGNSLEMKEHERPKRTCRNQRSYAPPKRGRGRGRGKRKYDRQEVMINKRARLEQDLSNSEDCTMITLDDEINEGRHNSSELYKALRQPLKNTIIAHGSGSLDQDPSLLNSRIMSGLGQDVAAGGSKARLIADNLKKGELKDSKEAFGTPDRQNWLTPSSRKYLEVNRSDGMSTIHVIDEETRMSGEPTSRSQTPARNLAGHASETLVNEESQGSVLSTATTESEKVKVKNRRMEINFDPDEGPFTVDKIAEYEWPVDRKGETFMIQEQISQYLGVKSFKRKYPDLKRRMVDMEERNYLRENGLVSEAMCDMGLTAIYSSEVLDIMCGDFPDQYEEYRKHMREKQIKEHSKKQKELSAAATAEKNRIDLAEMAVQSALSWNVSLNKARKESRRCSLDLQTFTIHVPKKQQKVDEQSKVSHYPVALVPGQYTDYYREYTPAELRYYPLNTVLYGPMRPNERKFDSQSEGSQSDSDSDSSSDDSSCSSSEGTQNTEESQSTMDEVDIELSNQKDKSLKCKMCLKNLNKSSKLEVLIQCGTCSGHVHPSCIDLTLDMVPHIQAYAWQCTDCKTCVQCHDPADEDKMLFCDMCDRGYHIYCVGLRRVPQGRWHCQECAICGSCGSREAGGVNADRNSVAQWQHEYKKGDKNTRVYVSTLCVPCSKLWRKGRYCPHCSRCHTVPRLDLDENLVHCSACDKYLHLDCVASKDLTLGKKNYQCDVCVQIQSRQRIAKSSASKVIRA